MTMFVRATNHHGQNGYVDTLDGEHMTLIRYPYPLTLGLSAPTFPFVPEGEKVTTTGAWDD